MTPSTPSHGPGPHGAAVHGPAADFLQAVVKDKLQFVEKAMGEILAAKQEAMEARIKVAEIEAKMRALDETMAIRIEAIDSGCPRSSPRNCQS